MPEFQIIKNEVNIKIQTSKELASVNFIKKKRKKIHKRICNKVLRKFDKEFNKYDDILMIRDSELINIIKNADLTSKYIIEQYMKHKNIIINKENILEISSNIKDYYKLKNEIINLKLCYRCNNYIKIKHFNCGHHIIPIKNGGDHSEYNKIFLCKKCHDYVEDETSKLYINNKNPSVEKLKIYIRTDFPSYKESK